MATIVEKNLAAEGAYGRSTSELARFVCDTSFEQLPAETVHATKRMILDEIVCVAAAMDTPMAKALVRLKTGVGGAPESGLFLHGDRLPAQGSAYIHAQLANLLDADETMLNKMHTLSASVFSAFSLAERNRASGKELITAIATGYDISARIGLSLKQFVPDGKGGQVFARLYGFSWMTMGATASAGRVLGLNRQQLAMALGQAYATTPVYFDQQRNKRAMMRDGPRASWHKYQMTGAMAEAAINAAELVSYGWVAQSDIFDEDSEFWLSFGALDYDWDTMYDGLGERWYITDCAVKPYPFCRFGHQTLDLMTEIVETHALRPEDVEAIHVRFPPHQLSEQLASTRFADEGMKLMSSLPTALSLVTLGIPPGPKWFNADLTGEAVRSIARRVTYEIEPAWGPRLAEQMDRDGVLRYIPAEVTVKTNCGKTFRRSAESACGDPWAPDFAMSDAQLARKAHSFLDGILSKDRIDDLINAVLSLDAAGDVQTIVHATVRDGLS